MKKSLFCLFLLACVCLVLAASNGHASSATAPTSQGGTTYHVTLVVHQQSQLTTIGQHSILGKPSISAAFIDRVLAAAHSPAAGTGKDFYRLSLTSGIDDKWPLSFFHHESDYGLTGEARITFSIGNSRCIKTRPCIDQDRGGYAQMQSWADGIVQWYQLIRNLYIDQWGRSTVESIIPKYAPHSDGNDEAAYIASLLSDAAAYRAGRIVP